MTRRQRQRRRHLSATCDGAGDNAGNTASASATYSVVYNYKWNMEKGWSGACRQLIVQFDDGSAFTALFQFK